MFLQLMNLFLEMIAWKHWKVMKLSHSNSIMFKGRSASPSNMFQGHQTVFKVQWMTITIRRICHWNSLYGWLRLQLMNDEYTKEFLTRIYYSFKGHLLFKFPNLIYDEFYKVWNKFLHGTRRKLLRILNGEVTHSFP